MRGLDGLFIDGSWVAPASTEAVEVLDAATGEPMASVVLAGAAMWTAPSPRPAARSTVGGHPVARSDGGSSNAA